MKENQRVAAFENEQLEALTLTQFDGCVDCEKKRADFVVSHPDDRRVIVELKGKAVEDAEHQILDTVDHLKTNNIDCTKISALVVCSRSPLATSGVQRMAGRLKRSGVDRLKVKTREWRGPFASLF